MYRVIAYDCCWKCGRLHLYKQSWNTDVYVTECAYIYRCVFSVFWYFKFLLQLSTTSGSSC